jgi:2,4-dienoyl-CoA reductase-like NADH-dependent reductase (Old Yellow Enzyme family)
MRLTLEVTRAVAEAIGPERTGLRLSPAAGSAGSTRGPRGRSSTAGWWRRSTGWPRLPAPDARRNEALLADLRKAGAAC